MALSHPIARIHARYWLGGALGAVLLFATACSSASTPPSATGPVSSGNAPAATGQPQAAAPQPKRGGILRLAQPFSSGNIDPYSFVESGLTSVQGLWYDNLLAFDLQPGVDFRQNMKLAPNVAESWTVDNFQTYTFKLRKGVKFHDGTELKAEDVVWSFGRTLDPNEKNLNRATKAELGRFKSVEALDDYTVRLVLKEPYLDYLWEISGSSPGAKAIFSKKFGQSNDLTKVAMGTGPFKLQTYTKDGELTAVRHDGYWQQGQPYLDGVHSVLKMDDQTMATAFISGQLDLLVGNDKAQADPVLAANPKVKNEKILSNALTQLAFNLNKKPLDDIRVRKAISLAIDRKEVDNVLNFGDGIVNVGPVAHIVKGSAWGMTPEEIGKLPGYRYPKDADIAEAKKLMAEAGYPTGFSMTVSYFRGKPSHGPAAEVVQQQLKKSLNIDLKITPQDSAEFTERKLGGNFDMSTDLGGAGYKPVDTYDTFHTQSTYGKPTGRGNAEIDKLIEAQQVEGDVAKRGGIFKEIQKKVMDNYWNVQLPTGYIYKMWQPWVSNWEDNKAERALVMNPAGIWMDVEAAPASRRTLK